MKLRRILIANRGEIALRVVRSCRELGIETVLAASDADLESVPARLADLTVRIGPAQAAQSYLNVERVIAAAKATKADAIHPGYGFLSENAMLAKACKAAGIAFIGPEETHLAGLGDKLRAREHALAAGLPVVPGAPVDNAEAALALAGEIGFPVLVKAVGGGGGRGMKRINGKSEMAEAVALAIAEAEAAFGDPRIYVERYVERGRHIEVQLLGDGCGNVIHLGERDCSIQRRYQKLVEEAPAPGLDPAFRAAIHDAAVRFGAHLRYKSAGTVEFLVDDDRNEFYFLEMNARIQVEHPVTEAITGLDLVAEQIAIEERGALALRQDAVCFSGHAIECRINAEDPADDFRPSPGTINTALLPAGTGIRVDTHIESGVRVPPFYDSLLAKIVAHGTDRKEALARMALALRNCRIEGVSTSIPVHAELMQDAAFRAGGVTTGFLPAFLARRGALSRKVG
ncbi:MAG: acetyl-CoA carboxylase biotin carboxylase subunit [Bradyrhizobiaceae bacterium]|nr:acetyl-CoA carboxylase biotin carboxylase subunit [Bradyrhizobiaceae bacterium]